MLVFIAEHTGERVQRLQRLSWGRCWVERPVRPYRGEVWIFDNGAFGWWQKGVAFQAGVYRERLTRLRRSGLHPFFTVLPDVPAKGAESLEFSLSWVDRMPRGWPLALAVQDGMTPEMVKPHLDKLRVIFLGGTDAFKATARQWVQFAHAHGKLMHYGRCGTPKKLVHAMEVGADSLDSAFPLWTDDRFEFFADCVKNGHPQLSLLEAA